MNPIDVRKGLDDAIVKLRALRFDSNSEPARAKLRSAYLYLTVEMECIDVQVIRALDEERAA